MPFHRKTQVIPGHDCVYAQCRFTPSCKDGWKGHGIGCDRWVYVVATEDFSQAVSLVVFSGVFPDSIPRGHFGRNWPRKPEGADLVWHRREPEHLNLGSIGCKEFCAFVDGPCYFDASALLGRAFWVQYATPQFEQEEPFWKALEEQLK